MVRSLLVGFALIAVLVPQLAHAVEMKDLRKPDDAWFTSDEGKRILENILTWQNADGGWPKDYDYNKKKGEAGAESAWEGVSTFDDYATYTETRLMARAHTLTKEQKYREAFERAIAMVLKSQYPSGGWPQRYPPPAPPDYGRFITFNDSAMARVVYLVRDVAEPDKEFAFVGDETRAKCRQAYDRAVDCILKMQIKQNGKPAGWCAQHDPETLAPAWGRTYEPPSINSSEGSEVVLLLMEIQNPDERVRAAVDGAAAWFERSKIPGKRMEMRTGDGVPGGKDRVLVDDPSAPPIWARFYDIETNEPIFMDRDGKRYPSMKDLPQERRVSYAWYSNNGNQVLEKYAQWKRRHGHARAAKP